MLLISSKKVNQKPRIITTWSLGSPDSRVGLSRLRLKNWMELSHELEQHQNLRINDF